MRNKLFILTVFSLAFFACKKNDSNSAGGTTKTTLVSQQSWKFDNAGLDPDKNGTIDIPVGNPEIPACVTDNSISFATNGSGLVEEGATKCNAGDLQSIPFTWNFASNETMINITGNAIAGKGGQFKVVSITSTKFSLSKDTTVPIIGATAFIVNLKH